jgi:hypothetical protein
MKTRRIKRYGRNKTYKNFLFNPNKKLFGSFLLAGNPFCRLKFHFLGCLLVVIANQKLTFDSFFPLDATLGGG